MSKGSVQIDEWLFVYMYRYFVLGEDDAALRDKISQGLQAKYDAVIRRKTYTAYKTANSPQEREQARQEYLDQAGIPEHFRW